MRNSWLPPEWNGQRRIAHPVNWTRLPEFDVGVAHVQYRVDHGHENRWYLYVRKFNEADVKAFPVLASTVITSSPGTTQTITSDATWNNAANTVEVIGAGARGAHGSGTSTSGGGGGGGAFTRITNASITTPGTDPYYARVGGVTATDGTAGGDSWWTLTSPGTSFPNSGTAAGAKGAAALASATSATGGVGGDKLAAYANPATSSFKNAGGNGGNGSGVSAAGGGGGGGAAGWSGDGINVAGTGPTAGGAGNANASGGGTGGSVGNGAGAVGGNGTNIQTGPNAGSGGGGGGANVSAGTGGAGGNYGGGGGGGGRSTGVGGQGAQGVIVLTWTPIFAGTLVVTEAADTPAFPSGKVEWRANLATQDGTPYELLLHFDGANASTTIVDSGGKNKTVTTHGAAQIDTSQLVFSSSALKLAAAGDYIDVETSAAIFGTVNFTIDFRARLSATGTAQTFYDGGTGSFVISYDGTNLKFVSPAGTITGGALAANTNYHIAVTRSGGTTRLFLDGVAVGGPLSDTTFYTSSFGYPQIGGGVAIASGTLVVTEAGDTAALTGTAGGLDSATSAWIAAVGSGNVDSAHTGAVDTLIVGLKSDGIWSKLDRLWMFAAQNTNSALVDLVALDVATATNSPTFRIDQGYAGNGSTSYINTTYNLSTDKVNYTSSSAHIGIWDNTSRGVDGTIAFGFYDGGSNLTDFFPYYWGGTNGPLVRFNFVAGVNIASSSSQGFVLNQQISSTTEEMYYNGSSLGTGGSSAAIVAGNLPFFVGGRNDNGTMAGGTTDQISMVSFGGKLTSTQAANYYTRLLAYMGAAPTQRWIDAVVAAGGTVSAGRQTLVKALIQGLILDGVWGKLDRLWILAAENSQSALVDLVAQDVASAVNSPTFTADRGYAGNGSTSYIDTTFNPSTQGVNFTLDDAHLAVWDNTNRAAATTVAIGNYDGSAEADLFPYQNVLTATGVGNRINLAAADPAAIAYTSSLGFFIGQSISHATQEVYVNGTSIGTHPKTYGAYVVNLPFFVCAENAGGSIYAPTTDQICMASIGATLTSTQAANYYSRLRTYMTSVGVP
jgi:hypothetical protein